MNNELNFPPNFERLVLGCIDADFLQVNTCWKALDEIYNIYILLHRSNFNISEKMAFKMRHNFCEFEKLLSQHFAHFH